MLNFVKLLNIFMSRLCILYVTIKIGVATSRANLIVRKVFVFSDSFDPGRVHKNYLQSESF